MITVECSNCKILKPYPKSLHGQTVKCSCGALIDIRASTELLPDAPVSFSNFLGLFHHDLSDIALVNDHTLDLFTLKIQNNDFVYGHLAEILRNTLIPYVLSRSIRDDYARNIGTLSKRAREKFRNYWIESKKNADREGELGELLLYAFLESHLNAPKVLSKYEIKTSNNEYVKGADGVHLLKLNDSDYQLIFGESKLYETLKGGIDAGFTSILKFLKNKKDGYETHLVDTQLLKEAYTPDLYTKLRSILIPTASGDDYNLDHAFGLFIGFNFEIDPQTRKMPNDAARIRIRDAVKDIVNESIEHLNSKLSQVDLHSYSFYVYAVPFSDLPEKRRRLIEEIIS